MKFEDARTVPAGKILQCDVCIVGGGPAGITIARELAGSSLQVILLEAGGWRETARARDLCIAVLPEPKSSHEPLEENRRRQWGGATSAWGGRCIPFDAIDFEKRPWVPHSGWPITKSELDPFYARALTLCEAGEYKFHTEEAFPEKQREMIAGFDGPDVVSNAMERWGPPTHFGKRYARELQSAANITVLFNANCLHIQLRPDGSCVEKIQVASFERNKFSVKAGSFVIACGGLETARLLLASNDVMTAGIGNHADKLGRHYMAHLFGAFAMARLRDNGAGFVYDLERDEEQVYCRHGVFGSRPRRSGRTRMLNVISFFFRPPLSRTVHRNALFPPRTGEIFPGHLQSATTRAGDAGPSCRKKIVPRAAGAPQNHGGRRARIGSAGRRHHQGPLFRQTPRACRSSCRRKATIIIAFITRPNTRPIPRAAWCCIPEKDFFGLPRLRSVKIAFTDLEVRTVPARASTAEEPVCRQPNRRIDL